LLDIYHTLEHLAVCASVLYGEGTAEAEAWVQAERQVLLTEGADVVQTHLAAGPSPTRWAAKRSALAEVLGYFERRAECLGYAERLASGRLIGSGLVEGACTQVIGRRMKRSGARWRVRQANRMASLCCTFHGDTWKAHWEHRLN
jgi:hypothetical protein